MDFYIDENDNTYKLCPEDTKRIENNKCIKKISILNIILLITILIILFIIMFIMFCFRKKLLKKRKEINILDEKINCIELNR